MLQKRRDGKNEVMAAWKLLFLAMKLRRGWKRIPPKQRRKLVEGAGKQARGAGEQLRKHGPVVASRLGSAVKQARKRR